MRGSTVTYHSNSPPVPTPEMRKRVAEAVLRKPCRLVNGYIAACGPRPDQYHYRWDPGYKISQWQALVCKVALLIECHIAALTHVADEYLPKAINHVESLLRRSNQAVATNDVSALESLCFELMEKSDE